MGNTFLILTDDSPSSMNINSPGLFVEVLGNTAGMTFNVSSGAGVENLKDGSIVNLDGNYSDYTFQRNGTKMEIRDSQGRLVADMNESGNSDVTTVNFADVSHDITINGSDIVFAGEVISENRSGGFDEMTSFSAPPLFNAEVTLMGLFDVGDQGMVSF